MSDNFSLASLVRLLFPTVISGCILGYNAIMAWRRRRNLLALMPANAAQPIASGSSAVQQTDDEIPFEYVVMLGIQVDQGFSIDELPVYWTHAFNSIYNYCKERNHLLLRDWCKSGCDKMTVLVRDDAELNMLAAQCIHRNVYYVIIDKTAEEPNVDEPMVEEANVEEPNVHEPNVEEPNVEEPMVEEPMAEEPNVEEVNSDESMVEDLNVDEPPEGSAAELRFKLIVMGPCKMLEFTEFTNELVSVL